MTIRFSYSIAKEYENFRNAFRSLNHRTKSPREEAFFQNYQKLTPRSARLFVQRVIREQQYDLPIIQQEIEKRWRRVEKRFFQRADRLFGGELPVRQLMVYLTVHDRCSYNIRRGYFFIHLNPRMTNKTIMHELWHWYYYTTVGPTIERLFGSRTSNDIKESLTVLLNEVFPGLLGGVTDRGYPQHKAMRSSILRTFRRTHDVYACIARTLKT